MAVAPGFGGQRRPCSDLHASSNVRYSLMGRARGPALAAGEGADVAMRAGVCGASRCCGLGCCALLRAHLLLCLGLWAGAAWPPNTTTTTPPPRPAWHGSKAPAGGPICARICAAPAREDPNVPRGVRAGYSRAGMAGKGLYG